MNDLPYPIKAPKRNIAPIIKYDDASHKYWIDGTEVPSVSALLDTTTPKPALTWWGMRVGIGAVIKLLQENKVSWPVLEEHIYEEILTGIPVKGPKIRRGKGARAKDKVAIEALILNAKLDTNNIKSDAADRGTLVHDAIEKIGTHDVIPDISEYAPEFQGYIRAIARWWIALEPIIHRQEVITASREFAYAGRFDLDATQTGYGRCLVDFKTSKDAYDSHFEQLALYERGEIEMNQYLPEDQRVEFDHRMVVILRPDGEFIPYLGDHVTIDTAEAVAELHHKRRRDLTRRKAK